MLGKHKLYGIVAFCRKRGIGKNNSIPWNITEDLKNFKRLTENNIIIMGHNTYNSIPEHIRPLKNRTTIVLTKGKEETVGDNLYFRNNLDCVESFDSSQKLFIVGGEDLYNCYISDFDAIYVTFIDNDYDCDKFFPHVKSNFKIESYSENYWSEHEKCNFRYITYVPKQDNVYDTDNIYNGLVTRVLDNNNKIRDDRTNTGTYSKFGDQIRFDISQTVPLLTTKRVAWKSCIEELLWFLKGDTDAKHLEEKQVNIWNGNSSRSFLDKVGLSHLEEGDCGANYSFQWRFFGQEYSNSHTIYKKNTKYDQINNIVKLLKTNPFSRRIFLSAWNPMDLDKTVLPPCHVSAQFYVNQTDDGKKHLSCHMYQRSCDVFLGLPWNIFSYSILTYILAKKCNMVPSELIISFGDVHIYSNHLDQVNEQLSRDSMASPVIELSDDIVAKDFDDIDINDFELIGYFPNKAIKGIMSV